MRSLDTTTDGIDEAGWEAEMAKVPHTRRQAIPVVREAAPRTEIPAKAQTNGETP